MRVIRFDVILTFLSEKSPGCASVVKLYQYPDRRKLFSRSTCPQSRKFLNEFDRYMSWFYQSVIIRYTFDMTNVLRPFFKWERLFWYVNLNINKRMQILKFVSVKELQKTKPELFISTLSSHRGWNVRFGTRSYGLDPRVVGEIWSQR